MEGHGNPRNKQSRNWEQQSTLRTINKPVLRNPPVPPGAVPEHTHVARERTRGGERNVGREGEEGPKIERKQRKGGKNLSKSDQRWNTFYCKRYLHCKLGEIKIANQSTTSSCNDIFNEWNLSHPPPCMYVCMYSMYACMHACICA